jgi:GNAT superfamily N-acetyltransferase
MDIEFTGAADRGVYEALRDQIEAFNAQRTGITEPDRPLGIFLRDPATGVVQGGLTAISYYRWMMLDIVFLPEAMRGRGLGRRLVQAAEREAVARGCIGVWLQSYSFQAPGLYRRLGYQETGFLPFPNGHQAVFFQKRDLAGGTGAADGFEVTGNPTAADEAAILDAITAYNTPFAGPRDARRFGLVVRDPDTRAVVGGLWGWPVYGLLFLGYLILPEHLRRSGLGTRLMREAEKIARERGYRGVFLDTFSFQARPFYERLGYAVFTVFDDYPPGHRRFLMAKRFAEDRP